ncbi:MAG: Gfo/Idh/MocA family oxidoreductase, partial [Clostridia bacterium]|nr:Gfo/Idh/MocA family oxidoreductase [Clostridia bacterium]
MKKIKVGIAGSRGLSTVMGLRALPDVEITALCNLDEATLDAQAKELGVEHKYRVFEDMLTSDIDAVVIATPMQCHVPQAIAALEAGKHVMSEVTAGVTMDELWWLIETVEKSGKIYMMAENYIYTPQVQMVKEMVKAGLFGDTYYAEGMYLHNIDGLFKYPDGRSTWRSFWQCGKRGNFYPTHSVGPVMNWFPGDRSTEITTYSPGVYNELGLRQKEPKNKKMISPDEALGKLKEFFSGDRKIIFILTFLFGMFVHFLLLGSLIQSQDGLMHALH